MLHYVTIGSNDIARAARFYDAAMTALGLECRHSSEDELAYAAPKDTKCRLWVVTPFDGKAANPGNGTMIALHAASRAAVDAFHAAAMANGGKDEGAPGLRAYGPDFYACYIRDPDGNKLSVVCEAPSIS
jgi:catechol 2,3-dioxygenase-like lactoylglutathione lyase family enzyme